MSKVAIVFWSQTDNTETMANCIAEGAGANATIIPCRMYLRSSVQGCPPWNCRNRFH